MPRYFFDVHDGHAQRDDVGTECADLEDVRIAARRFLPDIVQYEEGTMRIGAPTPCL